MSESARMESCQRWCMIISIVVAVVAFLFVWLSMGWNIILGLIIGIAAFFILKMLLKSVCGEPEAAAPPAPTQKAAAPASKPAAPAPAAETAPGAPAAMAAAAAAPAPTPAPTPAPASAGGHWSESVDAASGKTSDARGQSELKPSTTLSEEATLRDKVGSWKYQAEGEAPSAKKPETLGTARDGGGDDLTRIKGVGPKLAATLNELGFHHYDQIAAWTADEVEWVDSRLKFKGRIVRDGWIAQAAAFAKE